MLKNVLLLTCSIILALLMAEGLARIFISAPPKVIVLEKDETVAKRLAEEKTPLYTTGGAGPTLVDTEHGKRNRAEVRHRIINHFLSRRDIDFETNSLGYRNRELSEKSITRALFLGDSILEAEYVLENETFVRRVEQLSWKTETPLETINTGVMGLGTSDELAVLRETGLSTKPDIVVLCFYLNDFNEPFEFKVAKLPEWMKKSYLVWLVTKGVNFLMIEQRLRGGASKTDLPAIRREIAAHFDAGADKDKKYKDDARKEFFDDAGTAAMDWGSAWSPALWQSSSPLFDHFSQLAGDNGFQPMIVAFPVRNQVEAPFVEDYPQRRLKDVANKLNIPFLDLLPALREAYQRDRGVQLFYDHCHHTVAGQSIIAREIHAFMQARARIRTGKVPAAMLAETGSI
jgi:lysophospholipase L1-like esterase